MILKEGIQVRLGADPKQLISGLRRGQLAASIFQGSVVAALGSVAAASIKMSAQLDRDVRLIQTLGGEAAGNMGRIRGELSKLSQDFGRNVNELARANYQAVSAGFKSIADSMAVTRAGTRLAISGNADLVESTTAVAKWMKAFGDEALTAEQSAAQLWGTTRDGIVTVEQLGRFLADLPATMGQSGIKSYELVAALSTLTGVTGNASRAVDQLRSLVIKMEQEGFSGSLLERIQNFTDKGLGELVTLLGDQTAATGAQVLAANIKTLSDNVRGAQNVTGDFNEAVETMNNSTMTQWERLWQNVSAAARDLGGVLNTIVTPAIRELNNAMSPQGGTLPMDNWLRGQLEGQNRANALGNYIQGGFGDSGPSLQQFMGQRWASEFQVPFGSPDVNPYVGSPITSERLAMGSAFDQRQEVNRYLLQTAGGVGAGSSPEVNRYSAQSLGMVPSFTPPTDFITSIGELEDGFESAADASRTAVGAANILSSAVGGLLASAFVTAESAAGRFVQGLLAQFAQLGIQKLVFSAFNIPGFATGGYTGSTGGMVHPNEYVFNANAVRSIGLGNLERQHAVAQSGGANITINQTVNGGDPGEVSRVTKAGVMNAIREAESTGTDRIYASTRNRWR